MTKKKQPTILYNGIDITEICTDYSVKAGWADVYVLTPAGERIPDATTKPEQPCIHRLHGPVKVNE